MNTINNLNDIILYIENHLQDEINTSELAKVSGINEYMIARIFPIFFDITLSEYIRKRRLTLAGRDLVDSDMNIIDVAFKYGYESATAFSRAFTKFHGIKPSQAKKKKGSLNFYPKLQFVVPKIEKEVQYDIIELDEMHLYGIGIPTDYNNIKKDAPNFFTSMKEKYSFPNYGMVVYQERFLSSSFEYWVLWDKEYPGLTKKIIPKSKWLRFHIDSDNAKDIQDMSDYFYKQFIPTCSYHLKDMPELEYYHDGVTDFLIPIN